MYIICCFSLVAFNILFLSLTIARLITMCLSVFLLEFFLPGTLCFLDLFDYFLSHVKEVSSNYPFRYFLGFFLSLFSLWDSYIVNVVLLNVVPELFRVSSLLSFFFFFSVFCFAAVIFTIPFYKSLISTSASVILLLIPLSVLSISVCPLVHLGL